MKTIAVSGYFAPLHRGHVEYLKLARSLGDRLVVIVNNDEQLLKYKKRKYPLEDRIAVLEELKCVDEVFISIDRDNTVCRSLVSVKPDVFAKGGDRYAGEIPETAKCMEYGIAIVDCLGRKIQSSSEILKNYDTTE